MNLPSPAAVESPGEQQEPGNVAQHGSTSQQSLKSVGGLPDSVRVEVRVANITRQDLHVLESALSEWVRWHRKTYTEGYPPGAQLLMGSIGLNVDQLRQLGLVSWIDKLAPAATATGGAGAGAASYEEVEAPPLYDRAVSELLGPVFTPGNGISMLPGGAEAARRRAAAEACYGTDDKDTTAPVQAAVKRRKLSENRCFNCGSYAHGIANCPKPFDQERVNAARAEQAAVRRPSNGFMANLMRQRYFSGSFAEKADNAENSRPGCISAELAEALGMPSTVAPPPWLSRMAVLGVPPAYQLSTDGLKGAEDHMMFVTGSEDEGDEAEGQNGADRSSNSEASANSQGQQDPADADFVPLDGEAAQQQEGSRQQQAHKQQQEGSLQQPVASHRRCTQQFPGINAPLPDGADAAAWQAELDRASYASRMMGIAA